MTWARSDDAGMRADDIIQKAQDAAKLERFDSESFREGLELAAEAVAANTLRAPHGEAVLEGMYVRNLANRLRVADYARRHPDIIERPIKRPILMMGHPRTGTTMANNLLYSDPNRRTLLTWEVADPVPPAKAGELKTDPRCVAAVATNEKLLADGHPFASIHYEPPDGPTECAFVLAHDFKSLFVESMSAYAPYSEWLLQTDMSSAYAYHRLFLQVLQSGEGGPWNLKLPSHALNIRAAMKEYPDARFIWVHRDPYKSCSSLMSMIAKAERLSLTESDYDHIRRIYPKQMSEHLRRPMAVIDELGRDPFYHLFYSDLTRDPMGEMRKLYAWLGDDFTAQAEAGMTAWLAANPQGRFGKHSYGLVEFGLTKDDLTPFYEDYLKRFDIEMEG